MTDNQAQNQEQVTQSSDKELNFRRLEAKYQQELAVERGRREEAERREQELARSHNTEPDDDDDDSEPYVDHKKLAKKLDKFGKNTNSNIHKAMQEAKELAKEELKQELFLENHSDFHQVLDKAEEFAMKHPKLAESILRMPQSFERQKLVYQTMKELGMDKPPQKQQTIQEKIDANRKAPYYQPSGVGASPYHSASDFSPSGQKQAYDKMKELQSRRKS